MSQTTRTLCLSILLAVLVSSLSPAVTAQPSPPAEPDPGIEAMRKLDRLAGRWEGSGWMRRGPGEPARIRSTETVEYRLGGRVLVVEGQHWAADDPSLMVHHALGVISHDPETGRYRFRTYLASGQEGDHEMWLDGDAIVWLIDGTEREIRYTITIRDGEWHEGGEISMDGGKTWHEFFGMNLKRQR